MERWALDDIAWERFDRAQLDPEIASLAKAAALVEYNGGAYARHLCRVFDDDPAFQESARRWGAEEVQHGEALGRWAEMADPKFDFAAAFARFQAGYRCDFDCNRSRRGSRSGEMVARCIVETATSSYYSALRDAAEEPVLKQILPPHRRRRSAPFQALLSNLDPLSRNRADRVLAPTLGGSRQARRSAGRRARLRLLCRQLDRPTL